MKISKKLKKIKKIKVSNQTYDEIVSNGFGVPRNPNGYNEPFETMVKVSRKYIMFSDAHPKGCVIICSQNHPVAFRVVKE